MEIGETLYVIRRDDWRTWLEKNHATSGEIWLVYPNKKSGKPRISYDDAVEEALCFGWIDSIIKKLDIDSAVQRFSPRRKNSRFSELNRVRVQRMIEQGKMTEAGLRSLSHHLQYEDGIMVESKPFKIPTDILEILKKDPGLWQNFINLPDDYVQIRIGYIDGARIRPEEFSKRLNYFIKMTRQDKKFGTMSG